MTHRRVALLVCALSLGTATASGCDDGSGQDGGGGAGGDSGSGSGPSSGNGFEPSGAGGSGSGSGAGGGNCGSSLTGTIRDFSQSHPDFEDFLGVDLGIVEPNLGPDGKPVYASATTTPTTTGQANFDQWFRDVPGVNQSAPLTLDLSPAGGGVFTYDDSAFFPIDGELLGNEGNEHNFHFTFELHTKFVYQGGEVFTFTGDDDLFTFINGKLAIDLGGVHGAMSESVDLDARAAELGLSPGGTYSLDFFFAERHTTESNFRIDTTIASFVDCGEEPR